MILEIPTTLGSILLAALITYLMAIILHNYKAHQFFKLKSPDLPMYPNANIFTGNMMQLVYASRNYLQIKEGHAKYGKTYGFYYRDKPCVSTTDLELIKTMVIDEPNNHNDRVKFGSPIQEFEVDCIPFAEGEQWRRLRKFIAPAFTNHKIKAPNVQKEIDKITKKFLDSIDWRLKKAKAENGQDFIVEDVEDIFLRYSLSMVFGCIYKQYDIIDLRGKKDWWTDTIDRTTRRMIEPLLILAVTFPIIKPILESLLMRFHVQGVIRSKLAKFIKLQTKLNLEARKQLKEMQKSNPTIDTDNLILKDGSKFKRNLIDNVIDHFHNGKMTFTEYFNSTFFLFFAANKTPADALGKIIYHLSIHQNVQTKLRDSISKDGTESEYLSWVIHESLRLFPPVTGGCSRTVSRDIKTETGLIPAGTFVLTPNYVIHRLPEYWGDDAEEFRPERWENADNFHPVQYLAFGAGKRNCLGKDFALHTMKLLLVELLHRYKFETTPETNTTQHFEAPFMIFDVFDLPTYIKISPNCH